MTLTMKVQQLSAAAAVWTRLRETLPPTDCDHNPTKWHTEILLARN